MLRKKLRITTALALSAVLTLSACGGNSGSSAGGDSSNPPLTLAKPDGALTTESHNPYLGDSTASQYGYAKVIWEPAALVNPTGKLETTPWLAEEVKWSEDYRELKLKARSGVKWSDGEDFSADDIAFTFAMTLPDGKRPDTSGLGLSSVDLEGDTVTLKFPESKYNAQARVLHTPIIPKHIWEKIEHPATDPLTGKGMAVGTGPYILDTWTPEGVTLTANPNYWAGKLAVPALHYVSYGDNAALTTALRTGEVDWAQAFIPQIEESYLSADKEHNKDFVAGTAGAATLFMNLQKKPFNNVALRKALAWTIDRDAYVKIAREGASEAIWNITGLGGPTASEIIPAYKDQNYSVNPEKAKQILKDAGYTWDSSSKLIDPDGEPVTFSISVPAGWSDWNTEQSLIADQLRQTLGIEVKIDQPDWGAWDLARQEGNFDSIIHWLEDTGNALTLYTSTMDPRWIAPNAEKKEVATYNFGRYNNPQVTEALNKYTNAQDNATRVEAMKVIQKRFVEDVPAIPLGVHPLLGHFNTRNYVGWPSKEDPYASGDQTQPGVVLVLSKLKPAH